jgi:hypothetical protein
MSREAAKKIVDLMIQHGAEQNAVLAEIQPICSADEFQKGLDRKAPARRFPGPIHKARHT